MVLDTNNSRVAGVNITGLASELSGAALQLLGYNGSVLYTGLLDLDSSTPASEFDSSIRTYVDAPTRVDGRTNQPPRYDTISAPD